MSSTLVIGQNRYGHGNTLAVAKKRFRDHGGRLSHGYTVATFANGISFEGVDEIGRVHWTGIGEPVISEVKARANAAR